MSYARTAIASISSSLAAVTAPALGATAIKGALARAGVNPDQVDEVYMGNVVSANLGQAPARQATLGAGTESFCVRTSMTQDPSHTTRTTA